MAKVLIFANSARSIINYREPMIRAFRKAGHEVHAMAPNDQQEAVAALQQMNVGYQPVALDRASLNPVGDFMLIRQITRLLQQLRPDMLFNYTVKPVIYGSLAARMARIPKVYSMISGLGYIFAGDTFKQWALRQVVVPLYRKGLQANQAVFFQNPDDQLLFNQLRITHAARAVLVNGSGVDLEHFHATATVTEPPTFLMVTRLLKNKGIPEYAEAARRLRARYPDCRFCLLGPADRNPGALSVEQIRQWHAAGVIDYLGEASDVRPYLAQASVFVLPSSYREGIPRSILEAMAMGRPIITTDTPGCRETVIAGENGYLVPAGDAAALAQAMEKFIRQPESIPVMGKASRQLAAEKFDVNRVNATIMSTMGLLTPASPLAAAADGDREAAWP